MLVFFAGAAGAGIVSADFRCGAYYLDVLRLAAGTHRGAALVERSHGAVVRGSLLDAAALGTRSGFVGADPYQYQYGGNGEADFVEHRIEDIETFKLVFRERVFLTV